MKKAFGIASMIIALGAMCSIAIAAAPKSIANLQKAYVGETTAASKYSQFGADSFRRGYKAEAQLFRSAAQAEEIHAGNHAAVIREMGATIPIPGVYRLLPEKGLTSRQVVASHLQDAFRGEMYERNTMYPTMIKTAQVEGAGKAVNTFQYALAAETQHAALYKKYSSNIGNNKMVKQFYVCPVCGATWEGNGPKTCPTCGTSATDFKKVH